MASVLARLVLALPIALTGCLHEPEIEPPHPPGSAILLPAWVRPAPASSRSLAPRGETIVLGDAPHGAETGTQDPASLGSPSIANSRFNDDPSYHGYGYGYGYRFGGYRSSAASNSDSKPNSKHGSVPPVGGNWPSIPNSGPPMQSTTPVHP